MGERNFYLCISSIAAKDEEIVHFKEILSAKDKEIADFKEKLSELQQNRQEKDISWFCKATEDDRWWGTEENKRDYLPSGRNHC